MRTALLLFLFFAAGIAQADTSYRVEVILFAHTDNGAARSEVWTDGARPDLSHAIDLESPAPGFTPLDAAAHTLGGVASRLGRSGQYRVVAHRAWIQPGLPEQAARPVRISGDGLDGTITLILGRFLHLRTDLLYHTSLDGRWITARVGDRRKMRSGELHHIDHPLLGMIAEVRPVGD